MDSRGAKAAIKSTKGYQMSQNSRVKDLQLPNKQLKFITVNMLSTHLKFIDVQGNKLSSLPEELANLHSLEKL